MSVAGSVFVGWPSEHDKLLCTKEKARPNIDFANNFQWKHADAVQVGGCTEGCCADFECKACGHRFSEGEHGKSPV